MMMALLERSKSILEGNMVTKKELIDRLKTVEDWWIKRDKKRDEVQRYLNECIDRKDVVVKKIKELTKTNCICIINRLYEERNYGERKRFVEEVIKEIKRI